MNILFLSTENPYPPDHGHHLRTYNVLKYLAKRHNVFFLAFIKSREELNNIEPVRDICSSADLFILPDSISRLRMIFSLFLNLFSPYPYVADRYYHGTMKKKILEIIGKEQIDLIHFDMLHMARYRNDTAGITSVLTEHNVESSRVYSLLKNSKNLFFKIYMYIQYLKLRRFEKRCCGEFDICATVSEADRQILHYMSPEGNYVVVPNGVDTGYFTPGENRPQSKSLIWVGSMNDLYNREGIDYFLEEILPLIIKEMPDVKLTVIGKSPTKKLQRMAKVHENIHVQGYVEDVRPYINTSSVLVVPLKSGGGTKLKVLNALSMAKPVVTTTVGAEGIEVQDGRHLMIADNPEDFANKTLYLLKNENIASQIGNNGRSLMINHYDWNVIGARMYVIYDEALNQQNRGNKVFFTVKTPD